MSNQIPMISLVKKGTKDYPRYVLMRADPYQNPLFWSGSTWLTSEADAILFNDLTEALWVYAAGTRYSETQRALAWKSAIPSSVS